MYCGCGDSGVRTQVTAEHLMSLVSPQNCLFALVVLRCVVSSWLPDIGASLLASAPTLGPLWHTWHSPQLRLWSTHFSPLCRFSYRYWQTMRENWVIVKLRSRSSPFTAAGFLYLDSRKEIMLSLSRIPILSQAWINSQFKAWPNNLKVNRITDGTNS